MIDLLALIVGLILMALKIFAPWELSGPDVVFALGVGLAAGPTIKAYLALIKTI